LNRESLPASAATAIGAGVALVLLAATFLADWLRVPQVSLLSSGGVLSPNGDGDLDSLAITYTLSDDADVTVQVFSTVGGLAATLLDAAPQTAGQHSLSWAGTVLGAPAADGQYRIEITAAGAARASSQSVLATVDTTPPALELVNLPNGLRVGENSLTISGITEPGASLLVTGSAAQVTVDGGGRFSFVHLLGEGVNRLEIRAADAAGNTAVAVREVELVTAPPEITIASPVNDGWSNQAVTTVSGIASPGSTVTVNGESVPVGLDGSFSHQLLVSEGDNLIQIRAVDDVGNVAEEQVLLHIKTTPPRLTLSVNEGQIVNDAILQLSGSAEAGATVTVNGQVVPVSQTGNFQMALQLFEGANVVAVEARDRAGNVTSLARQVRYEAGAAGGGSLAEIFDNLAFLPRLTVPVLVVGGGLLAFFILRQRGMSLALSVDQQVFRPGMPGEGQLLMLFLDLDQDARVNVEVLDQNGFPRATIVRDRRRTARRHTLAWDGYDDFGRPLPPGDYIIQAEAGMSPLKVSSSVQVRIEEDILVHRQRVQRQRVGTGG
jgi:flagellar hook assembly protein FlgD